MITYLHRFSGPPGLKWGFRGKIGEGVVRYWHQRTRFYFWGLLRLCQFSWKSIKKCDRESACRQIHRQTDRRKPIL